MKILHTSDWHIGKQLKKNEFSEDLELFFDFLINRIEQEKIDVLLISGDLFDQANPSQAALTQYYDFLKRLIHCKQKCKVVITGGNHDSPSVLNAPKDLLKILDVEVIGGVPDNKEDLFVTYEKDGEKLIIAAVPFIREKDIRKAAPGSSYEVKTQQVKEGHRAFFDEVNTIYREKHEGKPYILMAHLFTHGASTSESERDIQVGNQAGIEADIFQNVPDYVALGHIHKPQKAGAENIRYSGSPIPLSFSEKEDRKQLIQLELKEGKLAWEKVELPRFRILVSFKGTLEEVKQKISDYSSDSPLPDFGELQVEEENEDMTLVEQLLELKRVYEDKNLNIIEARITFLNRIKKAGDIFSAGDDINNYAPLDLFNKRLEQEDGLTEQREDLIQAFKEIMEDIER